MAYFDWDLGNGQMWRIPLEDPTPKKRMFKIKHIFLTEAEQAREDMRQYYAEVLKQPVPPEEEEFAAGMIEAEKNPLPPVVPEPVVHDENYIPPMPEYGSKDFFIWCSKTKKAREALKKKKEDEKNAKEAAKTAAKEAAAAEKAAKLAEKEAARSAKEAAKAAKEAAKAAKEAAKAAKAAAKSK
jgi:colicin import membrane protein